MDNRTFEQRPEGNESAGFVAMEGHSDRGKSDAKALGQKCAAVLEAQDEASMAGGREPGSEGWEVGFEQHCCLVLGTVTTPGFYSREGCAEPDIF